MNAKTLIATICLLASNALCGVCPLCVAAAGAGVGLTRWLAIDDVITGLWIGGLLLATSLWLIKLARKFQYTFTGYPLVIELLTYGSTIGLLHRYHIIGNRPNTLYGFDRLVFGIMVGSGIFMLGTLIHACIKVGFGRILFRFQKIILPISILIIASLFAQIILWGAL